jgi:hypothetical protein
VRDPVGRHVHILESYSEWIYIVCDPVGRHVYTLESYSEWPVRVECNIFESFVYMLERSDPPRGLYSYGGDGGVLLEHLSVEFWGFFSSCTPHFWVLSCSLHCKSVQCSIGGVNRSQSGDATLMPLGITTANRFNSDFENHAYGGPDGGHTEANYRI